MNDLYPTGSSGDLQVGKETDSSESHFRGAVASVPVLRREKTCATA
ncbi:MAG: hypothetical protein ACLR9W_08250 [Enterobacter hormaechei]